MRQAAKDGIAFVFIKATEGAEPVAMSDAAATAALALDADFRVDWANAKAAGLVRGAYHFARPDLGNSPEAEADWFWSRVGPFLEPGDLIALDFEKGSGDLHLWAARFLARLKAHAGFNPLFYASPAFMATHNITKADLGGDYGLWEAFWTAKMPSAAAGWPFIAIWQFGGQVLAGIGGSVDGDIFNGDVATLRKYGKPGLAGASVGVITPPPPAPVYEAFTNKGTPIASGPDEAAIEASAVAWQRANLTDAVTITKDGKPYKTLAPIPDSTSIVAHDGANAPGFGDPPSNGGSPVVNDPSAPVVVPVPDVPEPPVVAEQGVTTSEWKLALGFLAQLAATGTAAAFAKLGYHVDGATLGIFVQLEFIGALAVASYVISRGVRKLGSK